MDESPELKKIAESMMSFTITPPKLKPKRQTNLLLLITKTLACILGPLIVPTIVYGVEGCTTLFWCVLGIGFFSSILLLTLDVQKIKDLTEYLKINRCGGLRCLIRVSLMFLVCGSGIYTYSMQLYEISAVCLFVTGVITGTFCSDVATWWNFRRTKTLPYVNFTKDSPKPVRPSFLDLRRKSLNVAGCDTNLVPLKRQLSSPARKSSNFLNSPQLDEMRPATVETPSIFIRPTYSSTSSSSGESEELGTPQQQPPILTPTKRRVIAAGLISLSPLANEAPVSKRRLELQESLNSNSSRCSEDPHLQTMPTFTYTDCNVENLLSQNFGFFHM